jgi:hypothetical protein
VISENGNTDGLMSFEQWKEREFDHIVQMHNTVMLLLDMQIAVVWPMDYIPKETPAHLLDTCRQLLLHEHVSDATCIHPKELAVNVLT